MIEGLKSLTFDQTRPPSVTDQVYEELYVRIMKLVLPPGAKLSEAEVAGQMGVSRQPVRDAFYRLSQVKLLMIRPQRATVVTPISIEAVYEAIFVRTALEMETTRAAIPNLDTARLGALEELLERQRKAVEADDREGFHMYDDRFHFEICEAAGHAHVWTLIQNHKAHMDRIRYLSLENGAGFALEEHLRIFDRLAARDEAGALDEMRQHLQRIGTQLEGIRSAHAECFDLEPS
ncbi:DNA-binding GntR family transcriptional regulator [Rhodobium orientis]|nr:GntR family transcriptional regulator [Rhodobium orientis]MBB4301006.1 DNA-binding GntR family transcriptional regulator [Rhodobium orientis]